MKLNLRLLIESIVVSILLFGLFIGVKVIQGIVNTNKHVPDIIDSYTSANYSQHKVSFGIVSVNEFNGITLALGVGILILLIIFYYGIRIMLNRWIKKDSKRNIR